MIQIKSHSLISGLVLWIGLGYLHTVPAHSANTKDGEQHATSSMYLNDYAKGWVDRFPLGNGRIGFMVGGGVAEDHITLNEQSLWSGSIQNSDNPSAYQALDSVRSLLFAGRQAEAEQLMDARFICHGLGSDHGKSQNAPYGCYQLFGNLKLAFPNLVHAQPHDYKRSLDLTHGVSTTSFSTDKSAYTRTYFTSLKHDVGVIKLDKHSLQTESVEGDTLTFQIHLTRPERSHTQVIDSHLTISGTLKNGYGGAGMSYLGRVDVRCPHGGIVESIGDSILQVKAVLQAYVLIDMGTTYKQSNYQMQQTIAQHLDDLDTQTLDDLLVQHSQAFAAKMNRMHLQFDAKKKNQKIKPLNERLQDFQKGKDPNLAALYMNFGRYLLLSSSRPGGLPANLQGLWNKHIQPAWNCDYHLNINLQMNYWGADQANLSETIKPLFDWVASQQTSGEQTAKVFYHAKGWVTHVLGNLWDFTAPSEKPSWGASNTSAAWLCDQLYQHYLYTLDLDYLEELYPVMHGAAAFFTDLLIKDPHTGYLVSGPSVSPENKFFGSDGKERSLSMGTTMDNQIISALYTDVLQAAKILGKHDDIVAKIQEQIGQIRPTQIGEDGRILEWAKPYEEVDKEHRHVSHLYALYPGHAISASQTPELAKAARKTLEVRGDHATGWSMAWKINFWNRLHDGNHAYKLLENLLYPLPIDGTSDWTDANFFERPAGTYPNLFCAHPPFQIDGNLGAVAGIISFFVQSEDPINSDNSASQSYTDHYLDILPACPKALRTGRIQGVRVKGGATVDVEWKKGKPTKVTIHTGQAYNTIMRWGTSQKKINLPANTNKTFQL